jgi:F-type H+-transporting ATPase subunit a
VNRPEIFGEPVVFRLGFLPVTRTVIVSGVISLLLLGAAALLGRAVFRRPGSKVSAVARGAYRWIAALVSDTAGKDVPRLTVFAGSLFAFITSCALVGQLPGLRAPTASLATDAALAMLVFVAVPGSGIATRGLAGYLRDYVKPNPLFLPLHIISELSRTLALALRLFGNMLSGHLIVILLVALVGLLVPTPLMALDLLIGVLQAYIFTVLSSVYLGAAIRVEEAP